MAASPTPSSHTEKGDRQNRLYSSFIVRAPGFGVSLGLIVATAAVDTLLFSGLGPDAAGWLERLVLLFALPGLVAAGLTSPFARALGGWFPPHRAGLLALMSLFVTTLFLLVWRGVGLALGGLPVSAALLLLAAQGPVLWFRHMSLFGVSRARHGSSLPPALLLPVLTIAGTFVLFPPTPAVVAATVLFLVLGFLCVALLLRAADRPLRREFDTSGVSLIRPMMEHVGSRDPAATEALEQFFQKFAVEANVRLTALQFRSSGGVKATVALPAVHPGPFAALGASDLPRKLGERLGPAAGVVFVPHTPCNHDLDVPTTREVDRIARATAELLRTAAPGTTHRTSPLVAPGPGAWARAQLLGDAVLVVATQAPEPTDDIDFAIADRLLAELETPGAPRVALVDAHNSYKEDEGDLTYGSPRAERFAADVRAAVATARAQGREGTIQVGVARREGYSVANAGIGPCGIRALVLETLGTRTAYVQIDGNNLVQGLRQRLLAALAGVVDAAEVMTTDNHVVHELDGGVNPVGERYPVDRLEADVLAVVREALGNLEPVELGVGTSVVPSVAVLGPDWTARLLTSLGDTLSMFSNAFLMTFLLLVASSLVILALLR